MERNTRARAVLFVASVWCLVGGSSASGDDLDALLDEAEEPPPAATDEGPSAASPAAAAPVVTRRVVEEIVVTANRRAQNVQDVVGNIRVLDADLLDKLAAESFADYVFTIPGVDVADSGLEKKIAIRGIGNLGSNTTEVGVSSPSPVGIYLNDTPIQGNGILPDLALYDLARIEVLKGPQGTLYGEGAQGGLIKMLLNEADPVEVLLAGEMGFGRTSNGSGLNNFQNLVVNTPIVPGEWGVRLVGSRKWSSGFVDYFEVPEKHANDSNDLMGRVHLDGRIWEGFDLSTMVLHERQRLANFPQVQFEEGDLRNRDSEPQFADTDFTLAGLTLDYDLGFAMLTSSTSGFVNERRTLSHYPFIGATLFVLLQPVVGGGVPAAPEAENEWLTTDNEQFSIAQEMRLVSPGGSWLDWVAGVFYRKRDNDFDFLIDNDASDEPPPLGPGLLQYRGVETFEQIALFGETSFSLPWDLELGLGLRAFREDVGLDGMGSFRGPFYPLALASGHPDGNFPPRSAGITTTALAPKAALSWFVDDLRMVYVQAARGVRSGGTNFNTLVSPDVTPVFEPDYLWTYELGVKTQWLDRLLTANLSLFYNDWSDLQVYTTETASIGPVPTAAGVILNVGRAFSRGAELELGALLFSDLTLGFSLSLLEGEISEGDPAGVVADGTPLPQLSELGYSASADYRLSDMPIFALVPFLHFDTQRTGDRLFIPPSTFEVPELQGFQLYNLMTGLEGERWNFGFGVRNLTNTRPELGANLLALSTRTIGLPRTWTATVGFSF